MGKWLAWTERWNYLRRRVGKRCAVESSLEIREFDNIIPRPSQVYVKDEVSPGKPQKI